MQKQTEELRQEVIGHLIQMYNGRKSFSYVPALNIDPNNVAAFIEDLMQNKPLRVLSTLQKSIDAEAQPAIVSVHNNTRILVLEVFQKVPNERKGVHYQEALYAAEESGMVLASRGVVEMH